MAFYSYLNDAEKEILSEPITAIHIQTKDGIKEIYSVCNEKAKEINKLSDEAIKILLKV
jgi:hypothetical protein